MCGYVIKPSLWRGVLGLVAQGGLQIRRVPSELGVRFPPCAVIFNKLFLKIVMEKIYSRKGDLSKLKKIMSVLHDFNGIIKIDNSSLYYRDSKLVFSRYNDKNTDLREIFNKLPEIFLIEVYACSSDEINEILDKFNQKSSIRDISKNLPNRIDKKLEKGVVINQYIDLYNHIDSNICKVVFRFKKYKGDEGILIFRNNEEILAVYKSKEKILEGKRALSKIKTAFAVSDVVAFIEKISSKKLNDISKEYPGSLLKSHVSFENILKKIREKEFKTVENDSLLNVMTERPSLIEIPEKNALVVSKDRKPILAFLKTESESFDDQYDGDKAFRMIKNFCILSDVKFKIYELDEEEFKLLKEFKQGRVKDIEL